MRGFGPLARLGGLQTEKASHRREVTVAVQQGVTALDGECADEEVYRLSDRDPAAAQKSVVRGGLYGELCVNKRYDFKLAQRIFHQPRFRIGAQTLQDLADDQIADQQRRCRDKLSQPADRLGDDVQKIAVSTVLTHSKP